MISLTRLNGEAMVLNSDLIRYAEANPDTVITLVTGEKIVVSESCQELVSRVREYRAELLQTAFPNQQATQETSFIPETGISAKAAGMAVEAAHTSAEANADPDESWRRRRRDND